MIDSENAVHGRTTLESLRLKPNHFLIFGILLLVQLMGGVSQQNLPYLSPAISAELGLENWALGALFGISALGSVLGAPLSGILGDLIGPKRTIIAAVLGCGLTTAAASAVGSFTELAILRFIVGFCIGGSLPNVIALAVQFAPLRERGRIAAIVVAGFPAGAALAGVLMVTVLSPDAWRLAFIVAGTANLVLVALVAFVVPESLPQVLARPRGQDQARAILTRLGADTADRPIVWEAAGGRKKAPLLDLLRDGRARMTLLLCAIFALIHIDGYFLANWLPILIDRSDATISWALNLTAFFNLGGVAGVILLGVLIDFIGVRRVLGLLFLTGAASLAFLALVSTGNAAYAPVLLLAGMAFLGGSGVLNALPALLYPANMRSTAGGVAIGCGQLGSVVGPMIGGILLQEGWAPQEALLAAAILPLFAFAMSMMLIIPKGPVRMMRH